MRNMTCFNCQQKGHSQRDCPESYQQRSSQGRGENRRRQISRHGQLRAPFLDNELEDEWIEDKESLKFLATARIHAANDIRQHDLENPQDMHTTGNTSPPQCMAQPCLKNLLDNPYVHGPRGLTNRRNSLVTSRECIHKEQDAMTKSHSKSVLWITCCSSNIILLQAHMTVAEIPKL